LALGELGLNGEVRTIPHIEARIKEAGRLGFGNGLGSGSMMTLGTDLAPKELLGEFLGLWRLIGDAGTSAGPIIVGSVAHAVGLSSAAVTLAAIGALSAGTIVVFVRETLRDS